MRFGCRVPAGTAPQLLEADAQRNRAAIADGLLRDFQQFPHDTAAVLDRAAVFIFAPVVFRDQEL